MGHAVRVGKKGGPDRARALSGRGPLACGSTQGALLLSMMCTQCGGVGSGVSMAPGGTHRGGAGAAGG